MRKKTNHPVTPERDELWSFLGNGDDKRWAWLAIDKDTREMVGVFIGDRSRESAGQPWSSLPLAYQQNATCYTDYWNAYRTVIPEEQHQPVGKETGLNNHIERFNNTPRQRGSRLVRKSLSPFLKNSTTISAQFGILFTIIMTVSVSLCLYNHSLFRTTKVSNTSADKGLL
jgi:IS1 family transposase